MNTNRIAHVASLVGEPARTAMLLALMDGRALTAGELAGAARITPATASRHLALLVEAALLRVERQGRHRYHRLASPEVARVLEGLMQLSAPAPGAAPVRRVATGPRDAALRTARTCYDHLAGRLGVAIAAHLLDEGAVVFDAADAAAAHATDRAAPVLARLGMAPGAAQSGGERGGSNSSGDGGGSATARQPHCRPCLDWSERRMHIAGRLGALLCQHCLASGWLVRTSGTRALAITPRGAVALRDALGHARWAEVVAAPAD